MLQLKHVCVYGFKETVTGTEDDTPVTSWLQTPKYTDGLKDIMSGRKS